MGQPPYTATAAQPRWCAETENTADPPYTAHRDRTAQRTATEQPTAQQQRQTRTVIHNAAETEQHSTAEAEQHSIADSRHPSGFLGPPGVIKACHNSLVWPRLLC